jgi:WXG100 family type VII secretion target
MSGGGWEGMNVDVVEQQSRQLQQLAEQTKQLINKIDGEVRRLAENWHGDDSKKYEQEWEGQHKQSLTQSAQILEQMGQTAQHQAQQQKQTSAG